MNQFTDAAFKILSVNKAPMKPKEIVEVMLNNEMVKTKSKRPEATLNCQLQKDGRFVRVGNGFWTIK